MLAQEASVGLPLPSTTICMGRRSTLLSSVRLPSSDCVRKLWTSYPPIAPNALPGAEGTVSASCLLLSMLARVCWEL